MAHAPPRSVPRPTRLAALTAHYLADRIDIDEFEHRCADLLRRGIEDEPLPIAPPPKPRDAYAALPSTPIGE